MSRRPRQWRHAVTLGLTFGAVACAPEPPSWTDTTVATVEVAPVALQADSATLASATATLAAFLEASREGSKTRSELTRLVACPGSDVTSAVAGPMLAAYELLSPRARADTVIGRAVVTTVAEQDVDRRHPGYFVARVRVRADTLEWDLVPSGDGAWGVCHGLSFGMTAPDSLTEWRPSGASRATARALADSISASRARNSASGR
ncbi:MAG: hypothetical protein K0S86_1497 [Geminicoccaceae bacterium]|nr:hypothetical protein [Geminicoccaceae bacterium]